MSGQSAPPPPTHTHTHLRLGSIGSNITGPSEICVFGHKMAFCWRFVLLVLLLVNFEIGLGSDVI